MLGNCAGSGLDPGGVRSAASHGVGSCFSCPASGGNGDETGSYEGHVMQSSAYTRAMLSDLGRALPFLALGAGLAAAVRAARRP